MNDDYPKPCVPTEHFYETFPVTVKNARGKPITGEVLQAPAPPGCYHVKWDHLKTPWVLHESFFTVVPAAGS